MKHLKHIRLLSALLALALLLAIAPQLTLAANAAEASGKCGDNLTWRFDEATGTLTITGSGAMDDFEYYAWGDYYYDNPWEAFAFKISSVVLPEGLTYIGCMTFHECTALTGIRIPESVTAIGRGAFYGCTALARVEAPDGLESIGGDAFRETAYYDDPGNWSGDVLYLNNWAIGLAAWSEDASVRPGTVGIADNAFNDLQNDRFVRVALPEGLKYIGAFAFAGSHGLTSVKLPESLTHIGANAFEACSAMTSFTIPAGVTDIGESAFGDCTRLTSFTVAPGNPRFRSVDGVLYSRDGTELVQYPAGRTGTARIPAGVTAIGRYAFNGCFFLDSIVIPDSVTSIGEAAFCGCEHIYSLSIPESVTKLEASAFASCANLKSVNLPSRVTRIADGLFYGCLSLTSFIVPETVTSIGDGAFTWCTDLEWVLIPESVTDIGRDVFDVCDDLRMIYGEAGSAAQAYAVENLLPFTALSPTVFVDLPFDAYYLDAVRWAAEEGVTTGTAPNVFSPDSTCTRAQVVTFLWRAAGCPEPARKGSPFSDVTADRYYYNAVLWAAEKGITTGTSATTFSPDAGCTRGQVVTFLWRAGGRPSPILAADFFKDVKLDAYYAPAVFWALEQSITTGTTPTTFRPDQTCTRAQIVTFLYRANTGSHDPNAGVYRATQVNVSGIFLDPDDIYDGGFIIELKDYGRCTITVSGRSAAGTWFVSNGAIAISDGVSITTGTISDGVIRLINMDGQGVNITLEKQAV